MSYAAFLIVFRLAWAACRAQRWPLVMGLPHAIGRQIAP